MKCRTPKLTWNEHMYAPIVIFIGRIMRENIWNKNCDIIATRAINMPSGLRPPIFYNLHDIMSQSTHFRLPMTKRHVRAEPHGDFSCVQSLVCGAEIKPWIVSACGGHAAYWMVAWFSADKASATHIAAGDDRDEWEPPRKRAATTPLPSNSKSTITFDKMIKIGGWSFQHVAYNTRE